MLTFGAAMDFSTNHEKGNSSKEFALRIFEDLGENKGLNTAEIGVFIEDYIDSRTELRLEIRKQALEFLKRAVEHLEKDINN
ncbi:hypothetical protein LRB91_12910 [Leclercia adecarboxylata]|uniref:hypothetical protein n=1 Tax=Leclercia adecarboxylata TaxID=83655 RepID=UPI0022B7B87B|nr:hypothetical protein [Leclercia adecarboxylata]MCZ7839714.1 hypothetical protein [Leclercia adecarboxylata]